MNKRTLWSRVLCVAGIVVIVLGVAVFRSGGELHRESLQVLYTLSGSALVALGAFLSQSRHRAFVYSALGLAVFGVSGWMAYWVLLLLASHVYSPPWILGGPLEVVRDLSSCVSLIGAACVLFEPLFTSRSPAMEGISMGTRKWWSRTLSLVGLAMIIAVVAFIAEVTFGGFGRFNNNSLPTLLILPAVGSGLLALSTFLGKSSYRKLLYWALGLTVCGLMPALVMFNGQIYLAPWLAFIMLAYPIGVIMSLVGAVLVIVEFFRGLPVPKDNVERNTTYLSS